MCIPLDIHGNAFENLHKENQDQVLIYLFIYFFKGISMNVSKLHAGHNFAFRLCILATKCCKKNHIPRKAELNILTGKPSMYLDKFEGR